MGYKFKLIAASAICCAACTYADIITKVTVETIGFGGSHKDSVQEALSEAVRMVNGSAFTSKTMTSSTSTETDDTSTSSENVNSDFSEKLKGVVLGYKEISSDNDGNTKLWTVRLNVQVAKYASPGKADEKYKIAIAPPKFQGEAWIYGDIEMPVSKASADLVNQFTLDFARCGRFTVLSREDTAALQTEKKLILENAPIEEMVKIGQMLGADYLVTSSVRDLYVGPVETKTSALTKRTYSRISRAKLALTYRVVVVATGKIEWIDEILIDPDLGELDTWGGAPDRVYDRMLERVGARLSLALRKKIIPDGGVEAEPLPILDPRQQDNVPVVPVTPPSATQTEAVPEPTGGISLPFDN